MGIARKPEASASIDYAERLGLVARLERGTKDSRGVKGEPAIYCLRGKGERLEDAINDGRNRNPYRYRIQSRPHAQAAKYERSENPYAYAQLLSENRYRVLGSTVLKTPPRQQEPKLDPGGVGDPDLLFPDLSASVESIDYANKLRESGYVHRGQPTWDQSASELRGH